MGVLLSCCRRAILDPREAGVQRFEGSEAVAEASYLGEQAAGAEELRSEYSEGPPIPSLRPYRPSTTSLSDEALFEIARDPDSTEAVAEHVADELRRRRRR